MQKIHILYKNESIEKIAQKYTVSNNNIIKSTYKIFNKNYVVVSGNKDDVLVILNYNMPLLYKVKENETLADLYKRGLDFYCDKIKENDVIIVKNKFEQKHIVKPLEKLDDIANFYNTTKNTIILENNLKTEKLYIGQILWL